MVLMNFLYFALFGCEIVSTAGINANRSNLLVDLASSLLDPPYSEKIRPDLEKGLPLTINISMYIIEISSMNEFNMDFVASMYFRRIWIDDRLKYDKNLTNILSISYMADRLWKPDIYFHNEKDALFHKTTVPNILIQVEPNGKIIQSTKLTIKFSCIYKLQMYPMDWQTCNIEFGSYGYRTNDIILKWISEDVGVVIPKTIDIPEYYLEKVTMEDCTSGYALTGYYTCLRCKIDLKRKFTYYMIQVYVPSLLVVILSWVSFWIDHHATPARITLGLLTVLTTTTQSSTATSNMPRVSYVKAIDVWLSVCLIFVFAALIEFAIVNVLQRKPGSHRTLKKWKKTSNALHVINSFGSKPDNSLAASSLGIREDNETENHFRNNHSAEQDNSSNNHVAPTSQRPTSARNPLSTRRFNQITPYLDCASNSDLDPDKPTFDHSQNCREKMYYWLTFGHCCDSRRPEENLNEAEYIDFLSRYLFPFVFIVFNCVYWGYYLSLLFTDSNR